MRLSDVLVFFALFLDFYDGKSPGNFHFFFFSLLYFSPLFLPFFIGLLFSYFLFQILPIYLFLTNISYFSSSFLYFVRLFTHFFRPLLVYILHFKSLPIYSFLTSISFFFLFVHVVVFSLSLGICFVINFLHFLFSFHLCILILISDLFLCIHFFLILCDFIFNHFILNNNTLLIF